MDYAIFLGKHKKAIAIVMVNVVGLVALFGVVKLLTRMATGPVPDPQVASEKEVVTYLASDRLKAMPKTERVEYTRNALHHYAASPERLNQLNLELNSLSDYQAEQLKENIVDIFKDILVEDSVEYERISQPQQRQRYIDSQLRQMDGLRSMVTGRRSAFSGQHVAQSGGDSSGGGNAPAVARNPKFTGNIPTNPESLYKEFVGATNPVERARLERYVGDLQDRAEQYRNHSRNQGN